MIDYTVSQVPILLNGLKKEGNGITQQELANKLGIRKLVNGIINNRGLLRLRQHFA